MGKKPRDTHSTFLGVDLARICLYSQGWERTIDQDHSQGDGVLIKEHSLPAEKIPATSPC